MAYTTHGHHIEGTSSNGAIPIGRMRCGGPSLCKTCREQALRHPEYAKLYKPPTTQAASGDILKMAAEVIDEDDMREHYVQLAEQYLDDANEADYASVARTQYLQTAQVYATLASAYRGS